MIVSVLNLKGGVGKTTTAIALASAAVNLGEKARLIDADTQSSASEWSYLAKEENDLPLPFDVEPGNQSNISRLKNDTDEWVFIDCPPTGKIADVAVEKSDFVIVPMTPSEIDMRQTWATIQTLTTATKQYAVLVVRVNKRTLTFRAVIDALESEDVSYFNTAIPQREDIKNNFGYPFEKLYGYEDVFKELKEAI